MNKSYSEIIADEIHTAGWSYAHTSCVDSELGCVVYVVDARKDGKRLISRADTLQTAYMELKGLIRKAEENKQ